MGSSRWLEIIAEAKKTTTMPGIMPNSSTEPTIFSKNGLRKLKILPFSEETFTKIVKHFYIHDSSARTVSRADISTFSATELEMGNDDEKKYPAFGENLI